MNSNISNQVPAGFGKPLPKGVPSPNGVVKSVTFGPPAPSAIAGEGALSEQPGGKRRRRSRKTTKKRRNIRRRGTRRHR